jgi:hypothetical protein
LNEWETIGAELLEDAPEDLRATIEARAYLLLCQRAYHRAQKRRAAAANALAAAISAVETARAEEYVLCDLVLEATRLSSRAAHLYGRRLAAEERDAFMRGGPAPPRWLPVAERGDAWEPPEIVGNTDPAT